MDMKIEHLAVQAPDDDATVVMWMRVPVVRLDEVDAVIAEA